MKRLLLIAALFAVPCSLFAQMVTVEASNLRTSTGMPVTGIITFTPLLGNGLPGSYQAPAGGQVISQPVSVSVTNGAFSISLPDVTLTNPPNICFSVTLKTGSGSGLGPGYDCVQPHGTPNGSNDWCQIVNGSPVCDFDNYVPDLTWTQQNLPTVQQVPHDMLDAWNAMVEANSASGGTTPVTTFTDSATVTWNATGAALNAAQLPLFSCSQSGTSFPCTGSGNAGISDGLTSRTLNMTGMVTGARYLLALDPLGEAAGQQSITFGTGCTWTWTNTGDVVMSSNTLTIPKWANWTYLIAWTYDGTSCQATVVD